MKLSEKTIIKIEEARKRINDGDFLTEKEVKERLFSD